MMADARMAMHIAIMGEGPERAQVGHDPITIAIPRDGNTMSTISRTSSTMRARFTTGSG